MFLSLYVTMQYYDIMLSRAEMIDICRKNDASYDGIFFIAVKSTQIYCLPSCTARFPKEVNIEFYDNREEAELAGYRGCLRCHSAGYQFQPKWLTSLVEYLHNHVADKLTMNDLELQTNRHRSTISMRFVDHYNQTPMEYFRHLKLETAKQRIIDGQDYRDVAFSMGYDSLSGFRSAFKSQFGTTPGQIVEVI